MLPDGRVVTASETEHPDLFWALRGGGGNFGIVTAFVFRCHLVTNVVAGPTVWPVEATSEVLSTATSCPRSTTTSTASSRR